MASNGRIYIRISAAKVELGMVIKDRPARRATAGGAAVGGDTHSSLALALALAGAAGFGDEGAESLGRLLRANGWLAGRLGFGKGWGRNSTLGEEVSYQEKGVRPLN